MPRYSAHKICHQKILKFKARAQYLNLTAPSNNVKMLSDKTIT